VGASIQDAWTTSLESVRGAARSTTSSGIQPSLIRKHRGAFGADENPHDMRSNKAT
jgi:hypothetical protein